MAAYAAHDNTISPADILRLATINGARALGLEQELGSLAPRLRADLCAIPVHAANDEIEDAVIHHTGPVLATWIDGTPVWNLSGVPGPSPEQ
jgi:imidazolonepropionase-like amidohydrolase